MNTRSEWLAPAGLVLLALIPAFFGSLRLVELASGAEVTEANQRFFDTPLPVVLHILSALPYSILGAFLFSRTLRKRHRRLHRQVGKVLFVLGSVAAVTGLWMAHFYPWPNGDGPALYVIRLFFGSMMLISLALAVRAVQQRDFVSHGAWMTRAYAIGVGAGTQVLTHLPWFILVGYPGEGMRAVLMGSAWVINLGVAEWIIQREARRLEEKARTARLPGSLFPRVSP